LYQLFLLADSFIHQTIPCLTTFLERSFGRNPYPSPFNPRWFRFFQDPTLFQLPRTPFNPLFAPSKTETPGQPAAHPAVPFRHPYENPYLLAPRLRHRFRCDLQRLLLHQHELLPRRAHSLKRIRQGCLQRETPRRDGTLPLRLLLYI